MSGGMVTGFAYIDNRKVGAAQINIEVERIDVSTSSPKSDQNWSYVDGAGHFHAYDQSAKHEHYPTLKTRIEKVPCSFDDHDSDCEGANITHWHCLICDEEVTPGTIPGPHFGSMPGLTSWTVKAAVPAQDVQTYAQQDRRWSVRLGFGDDREYFGVAWCTGSYIMRSDDRTVPLEFYGVTALGQRAVAS